MAEVAELLQQKMEALEAVAGRSRSLARSMSNLLDDTADAAEYSQDLVDNLDFLIEDLTALNDSLDMYYPDMQEALDDSARLAEGTGQALNSGVSLMTILQNTLRDSSEDMDQAARDSLAAGMELLDKSLGILDSTEAMRRAGRIMKDVADQELNKFDTENRFLFMDPPLRRSPLPRIKIRSQTPFRSSLERMKSAWRMKKRSPRMWRQPQKRRGLSHACGMFW